MNIVAEKRPFLTVMVPVYNGEQFVADAIRSVLIQPCHDLEVLVLDDGSTDNTLTICRSIAREDARVRVFSHANMGLGANRNEGFAHVRGAWLAFLDHDDIMVPDIYSEGTLLMLRECTNRGIEMVVNTRARADEYLGNVRMDPLSVRGVFPAHSLESWKLPYELATNWYSVGLIERNRIRFAETRPEMESIFRHQCAYLANRVVFCNKGFIELRRESTGQITRTWNRTSAQAVRWRNYSDLPAWHQQHGPDPVAVGQAWKAYDEVIRDFFVGAVRDRLGAKAMRKILDGTGVDNSRRRPLEQLRPVTNGMLRLLADGKTTALQIAVIVDVMFRRCSGIGRKKDIGQSKSLANAEVLQIAQDYPHLLKDVLDEAAYGIDD